MKILIIGEIYSENLGDRAIFLTLKKLFESQGHSVSGLDLSRRTSYVSTSENLSEDNALKNLFLDDKELKELAEKSREPSFKQLLKSVQPDFIRKLRVSCSTKKLYRKHEDEWIHDFQNHDLIIFGGGSLLIDNYWSFPLSLLYASRLAKNLGIPYGCVGCSVGEVFSKQAVVWLKEFLDGCSFITLRDPLSGTNIKQLGDYQYGIFIDSAICTNEIIDIKDCTPKKTLGINVLSYVHSPSITKHNCQGYLRAIKDLVVRIDEKPQLGFKQIILFNTGGILDTQSSAFLCSQMTPALKNIKIKVCKKFNSLQQLCQIISGCNLIICTRLHCSIISNSLGIPTLGISWSKKVTGFYEMINLKEFCFDYKTVNAEILFRALQAIESQGFTQNVDLGEYLPSLKKLPKKVVNITNAKKHL
jgi:polysaccharide pyruvyl transferase WcaK-like protein